MNKHTEQSAKLIAYEVVLEIMCAKLFDNMVDWQNFCIDVENRLKDEYVDPRDIDETATIKKSLSEIENLLIRIERRIKDKIEA